jgi:enoyl-CoA hydratase
LSTEAILTHENWEGVSTPDFLEVLMSSALVLVERDGPIATAKMNRPEKLNALSLELKKELVRVLEELDSDPTVRVIVLTGAGEKAFVAGADVSQFSGRTVVDQQRLDQQGTVYDAIDHVSKPMIARIDGYCLGGGLELAMACDIRLASERSSFGQAEINIGIITGGGGSQRLPRLVGLGAAFKLGLTGERIDAKEALRLGLVDEVLPPEGLDTRVKQLADSIAAKSAFAVRLMKAALKASTRLPLDQGLRYEQSLFTLVMASEDKEEGVRAFAEKRKANWNDR